MRGRKSTACLLATLFFVVPGIALPRDESQNRTLVINGRSEQVPVIQVSGRSYVDLEALARAVNGTVSYAGDQIALTLPGAPAPASNSAFSKEFLRAGIEEMATVREWHASLASAIQNEFTLGVDWLAPYRAQAATNLRLASVAASTDGDRSAYQLLSNEFQSMAALTDKYIAIRADLTYIPQDALQNDDLDQRIKRCGRALASMAASGQFVDDSSCH